MLNIHKQFVNTPISVLMLFGASVLMSTPAYSGGTFLTTHDLGFGGSENADPIHPTRFWQVTEKTMNRLVRPATTGEPSPDLAVSWYPNDSADVWTFNLREGVKFHDGTDFDAADVVELLNRIKDPDLDSPVASVLSIMEKICLLYTSDAADE